MATTTPNFGWAVPTSTDLVKDGAVAIETLGDSIDASLVDLKGGTTGQVLSKATNADMDFTWVTTDDANAIQNSIVDAKGDLIAASANDTPARLAVGTNGQVLTADSSTATGLKWATAAGGGKVLQVVSATYSTQTNNSTTTYADTNLTATITPTASTSKILVMVGHHHIYRDSGNSGNGLYIQLLRGATSLLEVFNLGYTATTLQQHGSATFVYLDSPATTSATTYKTQFRNNVNAGYVSVQGDGNMSTITLMEIGA